MSAAKEMPMDEMEIKAVFDIVQEASGKMQLHQVDEAFAILEGIPRPNLGEWPLAIVKAYEQLRRAKDLADQAETLEDKGQADAAQALWNQAEEACAAAHVPQRAQMLSHIGATPVRMEDCWPDVVRDFEDYLRERRLRNE